MPRKGSGIKPLWNDPDDAPEWTEEQLGRAELRHGDAVIRPAAGTFTKRGRPKSEHPKQQVTLRLDTAVLERFKSAGPGWQTRINEALKRAVEA